MSTRRYDQSQRTHPLGLGHRDSAWRRHAHAVWEDQVNEPANRPDLNGRSCPSWWPQRTRPPTFRN